MIEAQTTWALIVGIDVYDDKSIPELQGAVADALAAYRWLSRLGVPDQQILIHASPSQAVRADLDKIRPGCPPARSTDIDGSLIRLEEQAGSGLFVFLFGHGIFEPTSRRLFLTQEFKQRQPMNMGLDLFIPRFLEMPFQRQFLFMDGCQNLPYSQTERQKIAGSMFGGRTGFDPRPGNGLVACYAASKDQLALEVGGRGLFSRHLFEALDPGNPLAEAVDLDFATGIRTVDLRKVFFEHVQKKVRDEAWSQVPRMDQEPEIEPHGTAKAEEVHPIFRLSDERTAAIQVLIDPPAAAAHIRRVRIFAEEPPQWDLRVPRLEGGPLSLPVTSRIPLGLRVTAQCSVRSGDLWKPDPPRYDFEVAEDKTLTFQMRDDSREEPDRSLGRGTRSSPEPEPVREPAGSYSGAAEDGVEILRVRTRSTNGVTIANTFSYEDVAQSSGLPGDSRAWRSEVADGVWMEHHETGPDFVVERGRRESGHRLAKGWAQAIQRMTPPEVVVSFEAPASSEEGPVLRLELPPGGATSLAGFVTGRSVVWMGHPGDEPKEPLWRQLTEAGKRKPGLRLSLDDLERKPERTVEPGPTRVRLDLPWGSWASLVRVPESGEAMITLPATVGTPPLRVVLAPEAGRRETLILGAEGEAPVVRLRRGLGAEAGPVLAAAESGAAAWALRPPQGSGTLQDLAQVDLGDGRQALFPLMKDRALALDLSGGGLRVEALSDVPTPAWDLLVAAGRLDTLEPDDALNLAEGKWQDWLLGLAGAYVIYAQASAHEPRYLDVVLSNLGHLATEGAVPDLDLLGIALRSPGSKALSRDAAARLAPWAERGSVPVLRWGVALAVRLLERVRRPSEPLAAWRDALAHIEPRLSPISVWTAWTESKA